jgi:hypothetical protein
VTVEGFVYPMEWIRLTTKFCGMAVKTMGMLKVSVMKIKALTVKMETVTPTGQGR